MRTRNCVTWSKCYRGDERTTTESTEHTEWEGGGGGLDPVGSMNLPSVATGV